MQTDRRISGKSAAEQTAEWLKERGLLIAPESPGNVLLPDSALRTFFGDCSQMKIRRLREKGMPAQEYILGKGYTPRALFNEWLRERIEAGEDLHRSHHLKGRQSSVETAAT